MKANGISSLFSFVLFALVIASVGLLASCSQLTGQTSTSHPSSVASVSTTSLPAPTVAPIQAKAPSLHSVALTLASDVAYLGTFDNAVYAVRTSNGALLWRQQVDGSVDLQPIISNGRVYVSSYVGQNGPGYVYALRASDGSVLWRHTSNGFPYLSPGQDGSTVYLAAQGGIDALQAKNGNVLWHFSIKGTGIDNPVVAGSVVYATSSSNSEPGTLDALDTGSGRLLWQYQEGGYIIVSIVSNGIIYLDSDDGSLDALQASDGQRLWQRQLDAFWFAPLQLVNGVIYTSITKITSIAAVQSSSPFQGVASIGSLFWHTLQAAPARLTIPDKEGISSVYAIRASDGAILWRYPLLNGQDSWASWSSVANNVVYASAYPASQVNAGDIYALQSSNGAVIWHDALPLNPYSAVLANGFVYLSSSNQNDTSAVYAIRADDGGYLWSYSIDGNLYNAPALAGAALFIGAENGMAYALQTGNGSIMWHYQTDVGF